MIYLICFWRFLSCTVPPFFRSRETFFVFFQFFYQQFLRMMISRMISRMIYDDIWWLMTIFADLCWLLIYGDLFSHEHFPQIIPRSPNLRTPAARRLQGHQLHSGQRPRRSPVAALWEGRGMGAEFSMEIQRVLMGKNQELKFVKPKFRGLGRYHWCPWYPFFGINNHNRGYQTDEFMGFIQQPFTFTSMGHHPSMATPAVCYQRLELWSFDRWFSYDTWLQGGAPPVMFVG